MALDPVFTSHALVLRLLLKDGARVSYALNGSKDDPEMESFFSRLKCSLPRFRRGAPAEKPMSSLRRLYSPPSQTTESG
jgi:hypothetical protein